jgi:putative FmdB family regulatory protein
MSHSAGYCCNHPRHLFVMPTYDYQCNHCEHKLEMFQKMSESPKRKCPNCGKLKLMRLIGPGAGVIFKGQGFYCTDYGGKNASDGSTR